jgi:hypothetical protein
MTKKLHTTNEWTKVSDNSPCVIQNIGARMIEVATAGDDQTPEAGFFIKPMESFTYTGSEDVYVRGESIIIYDII